MALFSFNTTLPILSIQTVTIYFDYYLPKHFAEWEDKDKGSIKVRDVVAASTQRPLLGSSIEAQIAIRRACWDYLATNHLFYDHNVVPLPFQTTKNGLK